jgi:hypothetical protein
MLLLTGCGSVFCAVQPSGQANTLILQPGQTIGQTFTSHHAGLNGIELYLQPRSSGDGQLRLLLMHRSGDGAIDDFPVTSASVSIASVTKPGFYRFTFEPQTDSRMRDYFISLSVIGDGSAEIGTAPAEAYLNGAAYLGGEPLEAQLALCLSFEPLRYAIGFAQQVTEWVRMLLIGIVMLVLPGGVFVSFLWRSAAELPWTARLGLAIGTSVAVYPILALPSLVGVRLGPVGTWLVVVFGIIGSAWRIRAWLKSHPRRHLAISRTDLVTLILISMLVGTRFLAIGTLDIPMWGDSYQHTMMAQLIADNRGLFDSWMPYAELTSFTYHYGFHAVAANLHWLSGLVMPKAILWTGQILNVASVIALGALVGKVSRSPWSTPIAILVSGLLSSMPMFYLNWGRYTQLAGQVVLPAAVWTLWIALEGKTHSRERIGLILLGIVLIAGLALTHYRVLIFAVLFIPAYAILNLQQLLPKRDTLGWHVPIGIVNVLLIGLGGVLLFLPQFVRTFEGRITAGFAQKLATPAQSVSDYLRSYNAIGDLSTYLPTAIWVLVGVAIIRACLRGNRDSLTFTAWWGILLLAANPGWLSLPGTGALSNFAVFIAAYIPAGVLIGTLTDGLPVHFLHESLPSFRQAGRAAAMVGMIGLGVWGISQRLGDVNTQLGVLVTRPDLLAANWVRHNTPSTARFLVNTFPAYGNTSIVGSDGGWWLPLLANRLTNLPPLTYSAERGVTPDFMQRVNAFSHSVNTKGLDDPEVWQMMREHGITHIFIGQRQGRVNNPDGLVLDPQRLRKDPRLQTIYHQDRVWIFEVRP